jgi:hypothetical protein
MGGEQRLANGAHHNPSEAILTAKAAEALVLVGDDGQVDAPQGQPPEQKKEDLLDAPTTNGVIHHDQEPEPSQAFTKPGPPAARSVLNVLPPPWQPQPPQVISNQRPQSAEERNREEDSTSISPTLAKYAMSPSDAGPESILRVMQKPLPQYASAQSPQGTQSLPSLHTTLSGLSDPGINRINAPSSAGQPSPTEGSIGMPSTDEVSTPTSNSSSAQSYPTPNGQNHRGSVEGSSTPQLLNGPLQANGPLTSRTFKCTFEGCTVAPFQTEYLRNSHAHVHSSNRPHFCTVADCPRGPGGTGFKRKNEMIRHGLVHQSPGYIW